MLPPLIVMTAGFFACRKRYGGIALFSSLLLHALLLADLFNPSSPNAALLSQRKGATLAEDRLRVFPVTPVVLSQTRSTLPVRRDQIDPEQPALAISTDRQSNPAPLANPPPPPPPAAAPVTAATAGSEFVSPFALSLASPLGRAGWGAAKPPQINQEQQQYLAQQAQLQLRTMLMERLSVWVGRQAQQQKEVSCLIRLGLDTRQARLSCTPVGAEAELWSVLNGLAVAGSAAGEELVCLRAGTTQLGMVACEGDPGS